MGPTGSGKTPLGNLLEDRGIWERRCFHFDFGRTLRQIASGGRRIKSLGPDEIEFIRHVLRTRSLLDDGHFQIARKILDAFIAECEASDGELIVLNGLPRHVGQAKDMNGVVQVRLVVQLLCAPEIALARIQANADGDRAARDDDDPESVRKKRGLFEARTHALLGHYEAEGASVETFNVAAETEPLDIWNRLNEIADTEATAHAEN